MKVIAVNGTSNSGKTAVCAVIIKGLRQKGYSVGSVKEIHHETFTIDPDPCRDTRIHRRAGSQLVTARGILETDVLYQSRSTIDDVISHYDHDYLILEGVTDCNAPRIITAHSPEEVQDSADCRAIAVSGVLANTHSGKLLDMPIFHAFKNSAALVDFVEERAFTPLPSFAPDCCSECGYSCRELAGMIAWQRADRNDCVLVQQDTSLEIDGIPVVIVPFVQNILRNAVLGVASELDGFKQHGELVVRLKL